MIAHLDGLSEVVSSSLQVSKVEVEVSAYAPRQRVGRIWARDVTDLLLDDSLVDLTGRQVVLLRQGHVEVSLVVSKSTDRRWGEGRGQRLSLGGRAAMCGCRPTQGQGQPLLRR